MRDQQLKLAQALNGRQTRPAMNKPAMAAPSPVVPRPALNPTQSAPRPSFNPVQQAPVMPPPTPPGGSGFQAINRPAPQVLSPPGGSGFQAINPPQILSPPGGSGFQAINPPLPNEQLRIPTPASPPPTLPNQHMMSRPEPLPMQRPQMPQTRPAQAKPPQMPPPYIGGHQFMGSIAGFNANKLGKKPNPSPWEAVNQRSGFYNFNGMPGMQAGLYTPFYGQHDS